MSSDIHALSGAYAVNALDDIERAQFERHLAVCDTCRDEVDSLREASALLAEAVSFEPPAALRDRVLAGIETVRPLPPLVQTPAVEERRRRRFPRLVAAAAVVALLGVGGAVWHPWTDDTSQTTVSAADRVLGAPDAETWTKHPVTGGTIIVTRSASLNMAVVEAQGLAELPDGKTYEVWLQHDDVMVPAGLMDDGTATVVLEGDPATASATAVSVEPAGGSEQPTTFPIATFAFEQV